MFHLIATKTVLPTLKSARDYCGKPRPPQFILSSDDASEVYQKAVSLATGRMINDLATCLNGLPVFQTEDWTYHIIEQR